MGRLKPSLLDDNRSMEAERKETRADVLNRIYERMDRLEAIGIIGEGGDILINVEEAAVLACVEKNTILAWSHNAVIPRYKLQGAVRFGLRDYCNWIASCRQPSIKEGENDKKEKDY